MTSRCWSWVKLGHLLRPPVAAAFLLILPWTMSGSLLVLLGSYTPSRYDPRSLANFSPPALCCHYLPLLSVTSRSSLDPPLLPLHTDTPKCISIYQSSIFYPSSLHYAKFHDPYLWMYDCNNRQEYIPLFFNLPPPWCGTAGQRCHYNNSVATVFLTLPRNSVRGREPNI